MLIALTACGVPNHNSGTHVQYEDVTANSIASYYCINDHQHIVGYSTRRCQYDGTWGKSAPTCAGGGGTDINSFGLETMTG